MPFDLNVLSLSRRDGQDRSDLPGLYLVTPPRRAARGRDADRLILFFCQQGNAPLEDVQILPVLQRLAQLYYKTPGSITAAIRASAEYLNLFLLERNLRSGGRQEVGILVLAVLRDERLIVGHCGPAHTFVITPDETRELYDESPSNRGLGLTRATSVRYFQIDLHPNDLLVITDQPPPTWSAQSMQFAQPQGAESLRRRLLSQAGPEVSAVIVHVLVGVGRLRLLRPKAPIQMATPRPAAEEQAPAAKAPSEAEIKPERQPQSEPQLTSETATPPASGELLEAQAETPPVAAPVEPGWSTKGLLPPQKAAAPQAAENAPVPVKRQAQAAPPDWRPAQLPENRPAVRSAPRPVKSAAAPRLRPRASLTPLWRGMARVGGLLVLALRGLLVGLSRLIKQLLPDESLFHIPTSTMIFTAVSVAVIVSVVGGAVYIQRGRQVQFDSYYGQALRAAEQLQGQSDPNELRTGWETVLDFLDQAQRYGNTDQSDQLRLQAQTALDQLDAIQRLEFQPLIAGGLSNQIQAIRLIVTENDLYLLNGNQGNVLRAVRTGKGYELDPLFECGPNPQIGPLVYIASAPKDNQIKATLLAMDGRGNLLYCIPGDKPVARFPNLPQTSQQSLRAFALSAGDLYLLDPGNNQVWVYRNMELNSPPNEYFSANRPDDVQGMIDMAVAGDDVYLLHQQGYIVKCIYGGYEETPTRCEDPATFSDDRPGRKSGPLILDARFDQILITSTPEASLYLLDPINQAVYRFGLRLKFIRQFRPTQASPGVLATAFAITQNRVIYLVVGNQVYSATIP